MRLSESLSRRLPIVAFVCAVLFFASWAYAADVDPRAIENAIAGLDVADGLEATLFASEPMVLSVSDIDVDSRGRVWVCEVVNYRARNGERPEGDRILILEDTDGDGRADKQTVYYQGRDVDSAMGICVLGNQVIVSCSPNVFVFTDENGDDKPDRKEVLFSNTGQAQHDHSAHAFVFGPDGKLYWNFGNTGQKVCDKDGKTVVDLSGEEVIDDGKPYFGGMVFRCHPDGSQFEVLGHNFRNNYEVAVDAFGTLWQSDNDDDGNRGVRINYVMEFGNYGYRDEMTGAGWQTPRTGMEQEIPERHWHLNDPGVVPNLLLTGAGSPTGICVYEGRLLPEAFWDAVIHCDAGPNVVRAYPAKEAGAGFSAKIVDVLKGARDDWFRPSDVCVAPDGSLFVGDWYDPGVGGHRMGDVEKGRIYRIAPPNTPYKVPKLDLQKPQEAVKGVTNPCQAVRYLAWQTLSKLPADAEPLLWPLFTTDNQRQRARAIWLASRIKGRGEFFAQFAVDDAQPEMRIVGLRIARNLGMDVLPLVDQVLNDESAQVRRECAIALRGNKSERAAKLWAELAKQHDGNDRWYLEALGIGASGQWDRFLAAWLKQVGNDWNTPGGREILWRSRAAKSPEYLAKSINDPSLQADQLLRLMRAFDFLEGPAKRDALVSLAFSESKLEPEQRQFVAIESLKRLNHADVSKQPGHTAALVNLLGAVEGSEAFIELVAKFELADKYADLLTLAQGSPNTALGVSAVQALLDKQQFPLLKGALKGEPEKVAATIQALGNSANGRVVGLLLPLANDGNRDVELRRSAVRAIAQSRNGAQKLVQLAADDKLDPRLKETAAAALHAATWRDVKEQAARLFPLPAARDNAPLPPIDDLLERAGDTKRGLLAFNTTGTCHKCHQVNGSGQEVGPNLTEIGSKLSKQALFESILFPSAGISHNYENYLVVLSSGNVVNGIVTSRTDDAITIKGADAIPRTIKMAEVEEIVKQDVSLMPADLQKTLSAEELVDIVAYMATLKAPAK